MRLENPSKTRKEVNAHLVPISCVLGTELEPNSIALRRMSHSITKIWSGWKEGKKVLKRCRFRKIRKMLANLLSPPGL